jgi:fatty-acyl-CoA synthase
VVYHHRGAYINAASNIIACGMTPRATYLWTLPLFHCNGWCFAWTMAANGGTNICLRKIDPELIFKSSLSIKSIISVVRQLCYPC